MKFNRRQRRFLEAVCEAIIPKDAPVEISGIEAGTIDHLERFLSSLEREQRRLILWLFRLIGLLAFVRGLKPLWKQSEAERERFFMWLEKNRLYPLRGSYYSLKTLLGIGYLANPEVMKGIGYFKVCRYPNDPWNIEIREGKE